MISSVTVTTGARLHFGPLCYARRSKRQFGGIGLMVEEPGFRIEVTRSLRDDFQAAPEFVSRLKQLVGRFRNGRPSCPPAAVVMESSIPPHAGLGSGTQLALAVGQALGVLCSGVPSDVQALASRLGRGKRSAVGIHGFQRGGFLIDSGKRTEREIGTLAARLDVPPDWRFVLITPRERYGLAGDAESDAFGRLADMPADTTARLCRIALMELLPALREADLPAFGAALFEYGRIVGEFFAPAQDGVFADGEMGRLAALLRRRGIAGVAQSSWGPTIAAVLAGDDVARQLAEDLKGGMTGGECEVVVTAPQNAPAAVACRET